MHKTVVYIGLYLLIVSCVDPVRLPELSNRSLLVVDGMMTDQPGPHTVVLSFSSSVDQDLDSPQKLSGAIVSIVNDLGEEHILVESEVGVYRTSPEFNGVTGRTYQLKIKASDGTEYESVPALMQSGGLIDSVYREIRTNVINQGDLTQAQHALYLYLKGTTSPDASLVRWRWQATYHALTQPQLVTELVNGDVVAAPLPCSGHLGSGTSIIKVGPCECCDCWPVFHSKNVSISEPRGNQVDFIHELIGRIPLEEKYFYEKMVVQVEQLTMSKEVYDFWELVKIQTESPGDIFQPNIVKVRGNIRNVTRPEEEVFGVFAVSSVVKNDIEIWRSEVAQLLQVRDTIPADCRTYYKAPNQPPPFW